LGWYFVIKQTLTLYIDDVPSFEMALKKDMKKIDKVLSWCGDYCKHCFICINICPVKNLKFEKDEMVSLNKCIQCQLCMKYCPDFSIEVLPKK
tara:strand:+ start:67 stop:345 length:279 start_codon:yes stop_codon:yes gene_type:complete